MTTITFDTHKFIRTLKDAGVSESQTEAELATQHDINDVRRDINDLRRDMDTRLIQLEQRLIIKLAAMIAFAIGIVAVLVKLL